MLTKKDLTMLINVVAQDLQCVGLSMPTDVTFRISNRMTRSLGNYAENRAFDYKTRKFVTTKKTISLSVDLPVEIAKNTLMHEVLHAIAGINAGHGHGWAILAKKVNRALPEYNVTTYATPQEAVTINKIRFEKMNKNAWAPVEEKEWKLKEVKI